MNRSPTAGVRQIRASQCQRYPGSRRRHRRSTGETGQAVTELPADPLNRIESMIEIIGIAHAAIFTQHRRVIDLGRDDERSRALLDESVRIVFDEAPSATRKARSLAERWGGQQLLDPDAVQGTETVLAAEIEKAEDRLAALLERQEQIADELRWLVAGGPE